jgi:cyanophycinase
MALPEIIIKDGIICEALYKDDIHISTGLGLIKQIIVDTQFIKRGRFARLAHAIALNPTSLGIGLEENTAILISEGHHAECIGSGMVILIDGSEIHVSNVNEVNNTTPMIMDNLKVSILAKGSCFSLKSEKLE